MATEHRIGYRKILVVDDHAASAHHMVESLAPLSVSTRQASTGKSALRIITHWLPDLIFMDLCLPDMDGLEVIRKIQAGWPCSYQGPEFVVLTGNDPRLRRDELEKLGVKHAMTKPISGQRLRDLVTFQHEKLTAAGKPDTLQSELGVLFKAELEQRLPELDHHLLSNNHDQAAGLVHQLIASSAMTGEKRLESQFLLLNRLLRRPVAPAELARAWYRILEASQDYLNRIRQEQSDGEY